MIYSTLSRLYRRFVCHLVGAPPEYPQYNMDGTNKLRPDVNEITSTMDALWWAVLLANGHGASFLCLKHNCVMLNVHGTCSIFRLPLASALKLCNLIHSPPYRRFGSYDGMPSTI